jgi:hypothetical protein
MNSFQNNFNFPRISRKKNKAQDLLMREMNNLRHQMAYAEKWFRAEDDEDLIEACIFEKEALEAKHRYLLRLAKNNIQIQHSTAVSIIKRQCGALIPCT